MNASDSFRHAVERLLRDITPEDGAAILLLRHPGAAAFFPLALTHGPGLPIYPQDILKSYFLYCMRLDDCQSGEGIYFTLKNDSPIEELVLRGKLAIELFPSGPVHLHAQFCDDHCDVALCLLSKSDLRPPPKSELPSEPESELRIQQLARLTNDLRLAIAEIVGLWKYTTERSIQIHQGKPEAIARAITKLVSDEYAVPPYFSVLYIAVDYKDANKKSVGRWQANALAHNCYLLAHYKELVAEFIREMVERAGDAQFDDPKPKEAAGLPAAIAAVCTDRVQPIAALRDGKTRIFVRWNIPHEIAAESPATDARFRDFKVTNTNWELIQVALRYLGLEHLSCSLVTVWAGATDCDGQFQFALPVGFVPGNEVHALEKAATHKEIEHLYKECEDDNGILCAKLIILKEPIVSSPANQVPKLANSDALVRDVVARGASTIVSMLNKFPGPYDLDFKHGSAPLVISQIGRPGKGRSIASTGNEKRLWEFLYALCKSDSTDKFSLTKAAIKLKWAETKNENQFVDGIRAKLRQHPMFPIDPDWLIENDYGNGWRWSSLGSTYRQLPDQSVFTFTTGRTASTDPDRKLGQRRKGHSVDKHEEGDGDD